MSVGSSKERITELMNEQPNRNPISRPTNGAQATQQRARAASDASVHPVKRRREQKNQKKLSALRGAMIVVVILILVVGVLLLTIPMFRVKSIVVEGNSYYTDEEIIEASGIKIGDEILSVLMAHQSREIDNRMYQKCNLSTIRISCGLSTVTITVTEPQNMMYTEGEGEWYSLDRELRVWEKNAEESVFSPFLKVKLPKVSYAEEGSFLAFVNPAINHDYIAGFLDALERAEVLELVTYIDFSDKYSLSCVFEDTVCMELGSLENFEKKLECFYNVLKEKESSDCAVIDVSNPSKATYRRVVQEELYQ